MKKTHKRVLLALLFSLLFITSIFATGGLDIVGGYDINVALTKVVLKNDSGQTKEFQASNAAFSYYSSGGMDGWPSVWVNLNLPHTAVKEKEVELTQSDGTKVKVYVWDLKMSIAIKVKNGWTSTGRDYFYDKPVDVKAYFKIEGRYKYSLLYPQVWKVNISSANPENLTSRMGWWFPVVLIDGPANTYPVAPLQGGAVPNTLGVAYPSSVEEAANALKLPVELWVEGYLSGTVVKDEMTASHSDAPSTIVWYILIQICAMKEVDPTVSENDWDISDVLHLPMPQNWGKMPWWSWFILTVLFFIALIMILTILSKLFRFL